MRQGALFVQLAVNSLADEKHHGLYEEITQNYLAKAVYERKQVSMQKAIELYLENARAKKKYAKNPLNFAPIASMEALVALSGSIRETAACSHFGGEPVNEENVAPNQGETVNFKELSKFTPKTFAQVLTRLTDSNVKSCAYGRFGRKPVARAQALAAPRGSSENTAAYCHFGREPVNKDGVKIFEPTNTKDLSKNAPMTSSGPSPSSRAASRRPLPTATSAASWCSRTARSTSRGRGPTSGSRSPGTVRTLTVQPQPPVRPVMGGSA